ncbi:hypothetical protein CBR_g70735 [Chara braunii]|uniref:Uncharacterized protein n=1 Tax=Chara braunii TaxID=69332 RepID=A0A388K9X6_CHABU|nr:hypothetical protein CBR_g70735 [Chara braunii]|eukprot:GBG66858.1 hypothetical protein CBR_g70735 [Chara braunii]
MQVCPARQRSSILMHYGLNFGWARYLVPWYAGHSCIFFEEMDGFLHFKTQGNAEEEEPRGANDQIDHDGLTEWTLWQLLDSLLPVGGFTNSYGLEASSQAGLIQTTADLEEFCLDNLESAGAMFLPFVVAAGRGWWESPGGNLQGPGQSKGEEPGTYFSDAVKTWAEVDQLMDAYLTNHVGRRASCSQGCALLRLVSSTFPELVELKEMRRMCRGGVGRMEASHDQSVGANQAASGHHAAAFGALCAALGVKRRVAQRAFLFMTLRDILSAATRLNLVGPLEAAGLQHKLSKPAEKVLAWAADRLISDVHQTAPLWDLMQGAHDELFARLFRNGLVLSVLSSGSDIIGIVVAASLVPVGDFRLTSGGGLHGILSPGENAGSTAEVMMTFDRTPFHAQPELQLTVQEVPSVP